MFYLTDDGDGVRLMGIYRSSFHHSLAADVRTTVSTPTPPLPPPPLNHHTDHILHHGKRGTHKQTKKEHSYRTD